MKIHTDNINLNFISNSFESEVIRFDPGETIFTEGQSNDFVYYIKSGSVKIMKQNWTIEVVKASMFFGIASCFDNSNIYTYSSCAAEKSVVLKITKDDFKNLLLGNQSFSNQMIKSLCQKNELIDLKIIRFLSLSPLERLIHELLLNIKKTKNSSISLINKKELSELTGISIDEISNMLLDLSNKGTIDITDSNTIKIINFDMLKSYIIN